MSGGAQLGGIGSVIGTIAVPGSTDEAAIDVTDRLAFFGDKAGEVDVVDLNTMQLVGALPAEPNMHTLAVDPSTHELYVYENNGNVVDVWNYGSIIPGSTATVTPNSSGIVQLSSIASQSATVWDVDNVATISANGTIINAGSADQIVFADGTLDLGSSSPGAQVVRLYETVLGRAPDTNGLTYWAGAIADGGNATAVAQAMLSSAEGQNTLPSSLDNTQFVTDLYQNGLGRAPDSGGLNYYTSLLDNGTSRAAVAAQVAGSTEAGNDWATVSNSGATAPVTATNLGVWLPNSSAVEVENVYYTALNRAPDAAGLMSYTTPLENGTESLQQVVNAIVDSPEFMANFGSLIPSISSGGMAMSTSGTAFVTQIYEDALGRAPDNAGLSFWAGQSVGATVLGISQSGERLALNIGNQGIAVTT